MDEKRVINLWDNYITEEYKKSINQFVDKFPESLDEDKYRNIANLLLKYFENILNTRIMLSDKVLFKSDIIDLALITLLSHSNMFIYGPPGVAKSYTINLLSNSLKMKYFYTLLSNASTPQVVFGPIVLEKLKEGIIEHNIKGYLPDSNIGFIDEIFKCDPDTLNSLLNILNERIFVNGSQIIETALIAVYGASNEIPQDESLKALYDRFLIRVGSFNMNSNYEVLCLMLLMLNNKGQGPVEYVSNDMIRAAFIEKKLLDKIDLTYKDIIEYNNKLNKYQSIEPISDRRKVQGIKILKAASLYYNLLSKLGINYSTEEFNLDNNTTIFFPNLSIYTETLRIDDIKDLFTFNELSFSVIPFITISIKSQYENIYYMNIISDELSSISKIYPEKTNVKLSNITYSSSDIKKRYNNIVNNIISLVNNWLTKDPLNINEKDLALSEIRDKWFNICDSLSKLCDIYNNKSTYSYMKSYIAIVLLELKKPLELLVKYTKHWLIELTSYKPIQKTYTGIELQGAGQSEETGEEESGKSKKSGSSRKKQSKGRF